MEHAFMQEDCCFCSTQGAIILRRKSFSVRQCPKCSVIWCDPLRFEDGFNKSDEAAYLRVNRTERRANEKKLALLVSFAPPAQFPKLFEVGCMFGLFLSQAEERGYQVLGLDLSDTAVALAQTKMAGKVKSGTLDESIASNSYDVVVALNVIEHMDNPQVFLNESRRILQPHGMVLIETPSQEGLYHRVLFLMARFFPNSNREIGVNPGGHIFKYGKKAWKSILANNSYKVIRITSLSTPLEELWAKKRTSALTVIGLTIVGILARLTGTGNRVLVVAQKAG